MVSKKVASQTKGKVAGRQQTLQDLFAKKAATTIPNPELHEVEHVSSESGETTPVSITKDQELEDLSTQAVVTKLRMGECGPLQHLALLDDAFATASLEPQPLHPFFLRQNGNVAFAFEEPVELDDDDIIEISCPFPTRRSPPVEKASETSFHTGTSRDDPIVLDSSHTKLSVASHQLAGSAPLAPIFTLRSRNKPYTSGESSKAISAPYPTGDSQHVRGSQTFFHSTDLIYPRRSNFHLRNLSPEVSGSGLPLKSSNTPFQGSAYPKTRFQNGIEVDGHETNLNGDQQHPAISRFRAGFPTTSHHLWVDKWRPRCAEEVLGNERNAIYLRDWLRALALQLGSEPRYGDNLSDQMTSGNPRQKRKTERPKRPRVLREVVRPRGRKKRRTDSDDETGWIVDDDESEEGEAIACDEPEDGVDRSRFPRLERRGSDEYIPSLKKSVGGQLHTFETLTNTILLAGPPGVGKTAAIYACAEELGWEVFEVYPGIGKRNATGLEHLVGDVGKNHHVKSGVLFSKVMKDPSEVSETETESQSNVQQSLVLLEEVDILFKDETNFWPAVINLIKNCKRPVVCTCNDVGLIPQLDLPLQTILDFQPCAAPLAASYLESLCSVEGRTVDREAILRLYKAGRDVDHSDMEEISWHSSRGYFNVPDLRQAINLLQFECSADAPGVEHAVRWQSSADPMDTLPDWDWPLVSGETLPEGEGDGTAGKGVLHHVMASDAEVVSFVDSCLVRRACDRCANLALRSCAPSADDEIGHSILFYPRETNSSHIYNDRDEEMASIALGLSRGAVDTEMRMTGDGTRGLFRARVEHVRRTAEALSEIVPVSVLRVERSSIQLDYLPQVRAIVAGEDAQEQASVPKERSGRTTRNSMRGGYVRNISVTEQTRLALGATELGD